MKKQNSLKIQGDVIIKGNAAIGSNAKITDLSVANTNFDKVKKEKINWTKWGTILTAIGILITLLFYNFGNSSQNKEKASLNLLNEAPGVICQQSLNGINLSKSSFVKISGNESDPYLYFPFGFILTVTKESNTDLIEPQLIISYERANLFYNAFLVRETMQNEIDIQPKVYTGFSDPRTFEMTRPLYYYLDSPNRAIITLPDVTDINKKLSVNVDFLLDINHDCGRSFPIKFSLIEKVHNIRTEEKTGILSVVRRLS